MRAVIPDYQPGLVNHGLGKALLHAAQRRAFVKLLVIDHHKYEIFHADFQIMALVHAPLPSSSSGSGPAQSGEALIKVVESGLLAGSIRRSGQALRPGARCECLFEIATFHILDRTVPPSRAARL